MIAVLINLIITLLIVGVVWWAVTAILGLIPMPEPIKRVINILLILVLAIIVIYSLVPLLNVGVKLR